MQEPMSCSSQNNPLQLDFHRLDYDHIEEILEIERMVQYEPWNVDMFAEEADHPRSFSWVVCRNKKVVGYLCSRVVHDFMEILNVAVHPDHQRYGIGSAVFLWVLHKAVSEKGVRCVHLEVRASNESAIRLYLRHGFKIVGERQGYYLTPSGREKALLMDWRKN